MSKRNQKHPTNTDNGDECYVCKAPLKKSILLSFKVKYYGSWIRHVCSLDEIPKASKMLGEEAASRSTKDLLGIE